MSLEMPYTAIAYKFSNQHFVLMFSIHPNFNELHMYVPLNYNGYIFDKTMKVTSKCGRGVRVQKKLFKMSMNTV